MAGVRHSGLSNVTSADTTVTDDITVTDVLTVNGNAQLGNAVSDTISLYGVTAVSQRRSASQAAVTVTAVTAVATTATTGTSPKGFASIAHGDAVVKRVSQLRTDMVAMGTLVTRLRADLVAIGVIKGAA